MIGNSTFSITTALQLQSLWINRAVAGPNGDGDFHDGDPADKAPCLLWPGENVCASLESFHPKNAGTAGYARVMEQALADIGYKGS
ncbi:MULTISPECIES: hypothetical protein [Streptomyces]|uniref:hypothetical protein n=1 Tax=Streptomyces TaxID=1883 RepID=UPI000CF29FE1|nr:MULTISPECIES: hypothetical protein [Streptomyces]PPS71522.1 hypothetical protein BV882_21725 [Streptomyces sp. 46]